jgi:hypothetical protein
VGEAPKVKMVTMKVTYGSASLMSFESLLFLGVLCFVLVFAVLKLRALLYERFGGSDNGADGAASPTRGDLERIAASLRHRNVPFPDGLPEDRTCAICVDDMKSPVELLPCGHHFCVECLEKWWSATGLYRRVKCPNCRGLAEMIVPAYRLREAHGERAEQPEVDEPIRRYNTLFGEAPRSVRGFFATITNAISNQRFLPFMLRLRMISMTIFGLFYVLSPMDVISEHTLGLIGFIDDAIVIVVVLWVFFRAAVTSSQARRPIGTTVATAAI